MDQKTGTWMARSAALVPPERSNSCSGSTATTQTACSPRHARTGCGSAWFPDSALLEKELWLRPKQNVFSRAPVSGETMGCFGHNTTPQQDQINNKYKAAPSLLKKKPPKAKEVYKNPPTPGDKNGGGRVVAPPPPNFPPSPPPQKK